MLLLWLNIYTNGKANVAGNSLCIIFCLSLLWVEDSDADGDGRNDGLDASILILSICAFRFDLELEISLSEAECVERWW